MTGPRKVDVEYCADCGDLTTDHNPNESLCFGKKCRGRPSQRHILDRLRVVTKTHTLEAVRE